MEKASPLNRLIAAFFDGVILYFAAFVIGLIFGVLGDTGSTLAGLAGFILSIGYYLYFWTAWNGQTPGKRVMKIRIVPTDGSPMTLGKAILRYVGEAVSALACLLGYFWILIDKDRQGWHDKIAGTYVVNVT
ncbi:MAG: RDD family protein [Chloroflexi bacterium]|nr:RDD family protein [Chloroflexota bacterium]